jgi:hypothetical protein
MNKQFIFVVAIAIGGAVPANGQGLKEKLLANLGSAIFLQGHCPTGEVDAPNVAELLSFLKITNADIEPGGRYWPIIERAITDGQKYAPGLNQETACRAAKLWFGPDGTIGKGLMVPKTFRANRPAHQAGLRPA